MKTRSPQNRALPISKARWIAYASASAASVFAGSQSADAAIHYSGLLNVTIPGDGFHRVRLPLDQPGDSIAFEHRSSIFGFPDQWAGFRPVGRAGASFRGQGGLDYSYVNKLQRGEFVSHATSFTNAQQNSGFGELAGVISGYFDNRGIGFVGFAFDGGAGKQYGWARVFMSGYSRGNGFKVLDYAYADPGEPIQVGQTSSDEQGTPALGSLGLLAAGAAGLVVWRRRRSHSST
jgi:MYXO-CTERM domain-containing protein